MAPVRVPVPAGALCALVAMTALYPAPLRAQLAVTANAGAVRYVQTSTEQSAGFNPEFRLEGRNAAFQLEGTFTGATDGSRVAAGGPSLWLATNPILRHIQLDAQGSFQYTSPRSDSSSYAALGVGEIAFANGDGPGIALGAGGAMGKIAGTSAVNAFKARARAWFDAGPVSVSLAAEPTRLEGAWYTDYGAEFDTEAGHFEASLTGRLRQSKASGSEAGGELETAWHFTPAMALLVSGGRYLREPLQGLPAGNFVTVGLKFLLWRPHVADHGGVTESPLNDVDFGSGGSLIAHGNSTTVLGTRNVPSITKATGSSSTTSGGGSSSFGRSHKP